MLREEIKHLAAACGFELAGVAPAEPLPEWAFYNHWLAAGMAGGMEYLAGPRAAARRDPRALLASARSVICVGKLYNVPPPECLKQDGAGLARISRYAWGLDYHDTLRASLETLARRIAEAAGRGFEWRAAVDTAPLLERALARRAGLGWIGKNSCLINQPRGSWFFLGELLISLELEPDSPPPDRCGACTHCIDACPTRAIVPSPGGSGPGWTVDARLCISYLTIELRGAVPEELRAPTGDHVFGCDICQEVCPWNRRAPYTTEPAFQPLHPAPALERLARLSGEEFRAMFRRTAVWRARHRGFLRNVALAMGNSRLEKFRPPLERLAASEDPLVAGHARWALGRLR